MSSGFLPSPMPAIVPHVQLQGVLFMQYRNSTSSIHDQFVRPLLFSLLLTAVLFTFGAVDAFAQSTRPAAKSLASANKAGSVLFFHKYTSDTTQADKVNTLITMTNTNPANGATVRLIAVHECQISDTFINLAPNQSRTVLASKEFPDSTGYIMAVAVTPTGAPYQFNWLIGEATMKDASGFEGSYNALAVAKRTAGSATFENPNFMMAFDGTMYDRLPQVVAIDNIQSIDADVALYSPASDMTNSSAGVNARLYASIFDKTGKESVSEIDTFNCGLFSSASDLWIDQPIYNYIKAGSNGWGKFSAVDRTDVKRPFDLPVMGISFSNTTGKAKGGALAMPVLDWLFSHKIKISQVIPTIAAAPEFPGEDQVSAIGSGMSESKAGSILFYSRYLSGSQGSTQINLTNTHPAQRARVRLYFAATAPSTEFFEKIVTIDPGQAITVKASDVAFQSKGWLMAVAINSGAQPISFNYLIGSSVVTDTANASTYYSALAIAKNSQGAVPRNTDNIKQADLIFDDVQYDRLPANLAISGLPNQLFNSSYLYYSRLTNSLIEPPIARGSGSVTVYDDNGNAYSGLIGPAEYKLGDMRNLRFTPLMPVNAIQQNAGWVKLPLTTPVLAILNNIPTSGITINTINGWTGGLSGQLNFHILSYTDSFTIKSPAGNPGNHSPVAEAVPIEPLIEARSATGTRVRLDARFSSDEDAEDTLTYQWYDLDKLISTAEVFDFPMNIGYHEIKLVATDTSGEISEPYILGIDVKDTTAPTISRIPSAIDIFTSGTSAVVNFPLPVAYDSKDGAVSVTSSRASGGSFPLGTSTVIFTAKDAAGNKSTASMDVTVNFGGTSPQSGGEASSTAPFLPNLDDQYVKPGEIRRIVLQGSDDEGDSVFFRLSGPITSNVGLGSPDPVAKRAVLFIGPFAANAPAATYKIVVTDNKRQSYTTLSFVVAVSDIPNTVYTGPPTGIGGGVGGGTTGGGTTGGGTTGVGGGRGNHAPVARVLPLPATIESTDEEGALLQLDGSTSTDADVDSLSFEWFLNDQLLAQGVQAETKLPVGIYTIVLKVSDGRGGVSVTAPVSVQILPRPLSVKSIDTPRMQRGRNYTITVKGAGFARGTRIYLGAGINVDLPFASSESNLVARLSVLPSASQGTRDVIVIAPDGKQAKLRSGVTIQ
jgi:HYR domain